MATNNLARCIVKAIVCCVLHSDTLPRGLSLKLFIAWGREVCVGDIIISAGAGILTSVYFDISVDISLVFDSDVIGFACCVLVETLKVPINYNSNVIGPDFDELS